MQIAKLGANLRAPALGHFEKLIKDLVENAFYNNASEVVRDGLQG